MLLVCLCYQAAQAQPNCQLSGRVIDTVGIGLSRVIVSCLIDKDTVIVLTQDDGSFLIKNIRLKKFDLWITTEGYLSVKKSIELKDGRGSIDLAPIVLQANYTELDPVTVAQIKPLLIRGDTISYLASAFPVREGAEVEDLLKRLPGIEVDMNGSVIVQGKIIQKVLVDGNEFFGGNVLLATRNLPAEIVDRLQLIDDYGDKARLTGIKSGSSTKVLNIILRPDKRNGKFGRAQAGTDGEEKYAADAFANAFKGERQISVKAGVSNNSLSGSNYQQQGGFNYADRWSPYLKGSFDMSHNGQDSYSTNGSIQDNYYSGEQLHQVNKNQVNNRNNTDNFRLSLVNTPNNHSTLRITASGNLHHSSGESSSLFETSQNDSLYSKYTSGESNAKRIGTGETGNANVYYEHLSTQSRTRFSLASSLNYSENRQNNDISSQSIVVSDSVPANSLLHYLISNNSKNRAGSTVMNYFIPIEQSSFLELGYKGQVSWSQIDLKTAMPGTSDNTLTRVNSSSQRQDFHSFTQNYHIGYGSHYDKFDISAGIDGQTGSLSGSVDSKGDITSWHYFSFVPNISAAWTPDKTQRINLTYEGHPSLPQLQQLSPYTDVSNPQNPMTGNPNLKSSFTNTSSLHYEWSALKPTQFQGFGLGISYTSTRHSIITNLLHPRDDSQVIQETSFLNSGTAKTFSVDYHLSLPAFLGKYIRITATGNYIHSQTPIMTDSVLYNNGNWVISQALHLQLLIPDVIETDLESNYSVSHVIYPGSNTQANMFRTAGLSMNSRIYFLKYWIIDYQLAKAYTGEGKQLQAAPATLTAAIQRQFLRHNKATITLTGYDLLNTANNVGQKFTPTGSTRTNTLFTGRYFFCTFLLKLSRFRG
jgi:hypothetical protein